jgi:hypothetical protein
MEMHTYNIFCEDGSNYILHSELLPYQILAMARNIKFWGLDNNIIIKSENVVKIVGEGIQEIVKK